MRGKRTFARPAESACNLARNPDNGEYLNTLGVAQYRVGQYQQAVETLSRSNKLNTRRFQTSVPGDLAFLAMAHHQLGQKEQAQDYLKRLREAMNKPQLASAFPEEPETFLREAEALLPGTASTPNK
jgi:uncharacterized protein HemY